MGLHEGMLRTRCTRHAAPAGAVPIMQTQVLGGLSIALAFASLLGGQAAQTDSGGQTAVAQLQTTIADTAPSMAITQWFWRLNPTLKSVPCFPVSDEEPSPADSGVGAPVHLWGRDRDRVLFAVVLRMVPFPVRPPSRRFWRSRCPCGGSGRHGSPGGDDLAISVLLLGAAVVLGPLGAGLLGLGFGLLTRGGMPAWARSSTEPGCRQRLGGWLGLPRGRRVPHSPATLHGAASLATELGFPLLAADVCQALVNAVLIAGIMRGVAGRPLRLMAARLLESSPVYVACGILAFLLIVLWFPAGRPGEFTADPSSARGGPLDLCSVRSTGTRTRAVPRPAGGCTRTQVPALRGTAAGSRTWPPGPPNTWAWARRRCSMSGGPHPVPTWVICATRRATALGTRNAPRTQRGWSADCRSWPGPARSCGHWPDRRVARSRSAQLVSGASALDRSQVVGAR